MPSHKAAFRWRTGAREITDQREVTVETGVLQGQRVKVGGLVTERRSASRGGIHVCTVVSTYRLPGPGEPFSNVTGVWQVLRPDGTLYDHGQITGWHSYKPSDEVLEAISAGA